jgi:hypothetical protein
MVKMIGTVNGRVLCSGKFKNKKFNFDGTVRGLTRTVYQMGARDGDKIIANFGGRDRDMFMQSAPHDDRAFGFWAV